MVEVICAVVAAVAMIVCAYIKAKSRKKGKKKQKYVQKAETKAKERARETRERFAMINVNIKLSEAIATSVKQDRCNGEIEQSLKTVTNAKSEYTSEYTSEYIKFFEEMAIDHMN